eukprot:COSAG04_NODE_13267_length_613_cov_0.832685_2_plen_73_part_01
MPLCLRPRTVRLAIASMCLCVLRCRCACVLAGSPVAALDTASSDRNACTFMSCVNVLWVRDDDQARAEERKQL